MSLALYQSRGIQFYFRQQFSRQGSVPVRSVLQQPHCHRSEPHQPRRRLMVLAQGGSSSHAGKAVLHDFCMSIPYSGIALLSGLVALALRAPAVGLQLAGAGAVVGLCSVLSLKSWKAGQSSAPYTLLSAGASGWVAYGMWQRVATSVAPVPSGILLALSAALAAFCVYNILAGGNPPPADKTA